MRTTLLVLGFLLAGAVYANEPQVVITTKTSLNGYGTVAGRVTSDAKGLIGVSLDNGGVRYSTVADPSGTWAIVFRHAATNFTVRAWSVDNPTVETTAEDRLDIPAELAALPWSQTVYATESASSESSAKYRTQTTLNWRIDQQKTRCRNDHGRFEHSVWQMTCNKVGSQHKCTGSATCRCRP